MCMSYVEPLIVTCKANGLLESDLRIPLGHNNCHVCNEEMAFHNYIVVPSFAWAHVYEESLG